MSETVSVLACACTVCLWPIFVRGSVLLAPFCVCVCVCERECVCVCVREREREGRECVKERERSSACVCVCERERDQVCVCVCACVRVCVCVCEGGTMHFGEPAGTQGHSGASFTERERKRGREKERA